MTEPVVITEPGLHYGMPADVYHADPVPSGSLSSTFARLLTHNVPAKAVALRTKEPTAAMRFGTIAHAVMFGEQPLDDYAVDGLTVIEGDGRTKAVKEAREAAIAAGLDVVSAREFDTRRELHGQLTAMLDAVRSHPQIGPLMQPDHEVSAFWIDDATGVWCRARFDILTDGQPADYKSTIDASRRGFQKAVGRFGLHQQAEFYSRALRALGINPDPRFRFIAQENTAPYLVNLHECDETAMEVARALNDRALSVFADCMRTGVWPGYEIDPEPLSLPSFYFYDHEDVLPDEWSPFTDNDLEISA